jgi:hypothetical protein
MLWPTICVDNFFEEPEKVKQFSNTLKFSKDPLGKWPGERTECMHMLDINFFKYTTKKIMSLLFPMNYAKMNWNAIQTFQKIDGSIYTHNGWVHRDDLDEFTAIIYLSNHKKCGTSLFKPIKFQDDVINQEYKQKGNLNISREDNKYLLENNNLFEKTLTIDSRFNRLVLFDSSNFHAAEKFNEENINEDRLTLITFFTNISGNNNKYPITEMKRV